MIDVSILGYLYSKETDNGKGIFTSVSLPAGYTLLQVDGEIISFEETTQLKKKESYCLQVAVTKYVKPKFPFFLFNHSCNPNCALNADLELYTLRKIESNEELRWDYSTSMLEHYWKMKCKCGEANCRGIIDDFVTLPLDVQENYLKRGIVLPFIVNYLKRDRL